MANLFLLLLPLSLNLQHRTQVIFQIEGIDTSKGGNIVAGIFNKEHFPEVGQQTWGQQIPVSATPMAIVFSQMSLGTYAMVAFQDIDENGLLRTNFWVFLKNRSVFQIMLK